MVNSVLSLIPNKSLFSNLLENKEAIRVAGNIDRLTTELFNLIAKGYVSIEKEADPNEGDDYRITITDFGKKNLERSK